ncbi:MFS transporter [Amycolatopsis jiangsuensis]|uniref:MFS family permease n=1 Tax=Amycolatopsis jiangsuensis TaxID=1181879 RepID=A0A840J6H1_9PSEU|nr:MFS transporter [Amycolatopsis jiangsuensis]MBB4689630.1 MFS family permease [Amycolatopsis jiangsuensis]
MQPPNPRSPMFKVSLLSASLLLSEAGAVSPTLPYLTREFPGVSHSAVQSFVTMPALAGIVATLAAGALAASVGKRALMLAGVLLVVVGGVAPLALIPAGNFTVVMAARLLVGVGVGLLQPLTSSLNADFYRGRERGRMMGWQSSMVGIGNVVWSVAVAALMTFRWQAAFLVYLTALVIFTLLWRFLAEPEKVRSPVTAGEWQASSGRRGALLSGRRAIPSGTLPAAVLMMFMTVGYQALIVAVPFLAVDERHLTDGAGVSLVMTSSGVASIVAGIAFGFVFSRLRVWTVTTGLVFLTAGLVCAGVAHDLVVLHAGAVLTGLGFGSYMPFAITTMNEQATLKTSALVTAVLYTGASIGVFAAPYFFTLTGRITGSTSASGQLLTGAVVAAAVAIAATVFYRTERRGSMVAGQVAEVEGAST